MYCLGPSLKRGEARPLWKCHVSHVLRVPGLEKRSTKVGPFAFLPGGLRDLVSPWLQACECLQIQLQVSLHVIHSQQDAGGTPVAEQADTPTGWARLPVQGL